MIKKAQLKDVNEVVNLMMMAMGDLPLKFANTTDPGVAFSLLQKFVMSEGNQYSLANTHVCIEGDKVVGAINAYNGAHLLELRKPFFNYINKHFHNSSFTMETESEAGEFYIDTLAVNPAYRARGIGKQLLLTVIDFAAANGIDKVGLLVSAPDAKRLYEKAGFVTVGIKNLLGKIHEHMVYSIA